MSEAAAKAPAKPLTSTDKLKIGLALTAILATGGWLWIYSARSEGPKTDPMPVEQALPPELLEEAQEENEEKDRLHEEDIPAIEGAG
ncbi:MAG TPA: hypothetical protein VD963_02655 [Phycisphaerales bacterium]|nr:hypothetical protein [Phycisphaerales bacterium]